MREIVVLNNYRVAISKTYKKYFRIYLFAMMPIARSHIAGNRLTKFFIHKLLRSAILRYCDLAMVAMLSQTNAAMLYLCDFTLLRWCDLRCCEANRKIAPSQIVRAQYLRKATCHKLTHIYTI